MHIIGNYRCGYFHYMHLMVTYLVYSISLWFDFGKIPHPNMTQDGLSENVSQYPGLVVCTGSMISIFISLQIIVNDVTYNYWELHGWFLKHYTYVSFDPP